MSPRWSSRCASGLRRSRPTASFRPPASKPAAPAHLAALGRAAGASDPPRSHRPRSGRWPGPPRSYWPQACCPGPPRGPRPRGWRCPAHLAVLGRAAGAAPAHLAAAGSAAGGARSTSQPQAAWRGPSQPSSQPGWRLGVNLAREAVLAWLGPFCSGLSLSWRLGLVPSGHGAGRGVAVPGVTQPGAGSAGCPASGFRWWAGWVTRGQPAGWSGPAGWPLPAAVGSWPLPPALAWRPPRHPAVWPRLAHPAG
jgi:hypothetical protein